MSANTNSCQVKIDSELHKQAKIEAVQKGIKLQAWYDAVIRRALGQKKSTKQPA